MVGGARAETNIIITEIKTGYANGGVHETRSVTHEYVARRRLIRLSKRPV